MLFWVASCYFLSIKTSTRVVPSKKMTFGEKKILTIFGPLGGPQGYPISRLLGRNYKIASIGPNRIPIWHSLQKIKFLALTAYSGPFLGSKNRRASSNMKKPVNNRNTNQIQFCSIQVLVATVGQPSKLFLKFFITYSS